MKIAAAAYPIDWHNRWNEYVGKLRVWVRTAAQNGADLLVFPEYAALELASLAQEENAKDIQRAYAALNARIKDVDELHASLAREFDVLICAGSGPLKAEGGEIVNRTRLFSPDGSVGIQDKQCPTPIESEAGIAPGRVGRVFETRLGRIGILPGRDGAVFALGRAMAQAGADILLLPCALGDSHSYTRTRISARARSVEDQCFVVHAVTVGDADWLATATTNVGAASIFAPPDKGFPADGVIASGKMNAAGWVYGEIDLEPLRVIRERRAAEDPALWDALGRAPGEVEVVSLRRVDAAEPA